MINFSRHRSIMADAALLLGVASLRAMTRSLVRTTNHLTAGVVLSLAAISTQPELQMEGFTCAW